MTVAENNWIGNLTPMENNQHLTPKFFVGSPQSIRQDANDTGENINAKYIIYDKHDKYIFFKTEFLLIKLMKINSLNSL